MYIQIRAAVVITVVSPFSWSSSTSVVLSLWSYTDPKLKEEWNIFTYFLRSKEVIQWPPKHRLWTFTWTSGQGENGVLPPPFFLSLVVGPSMPAALCERLVARFHILTNGLLRLNMIVLARAVAVDSSPGLWDGRLNRWSLAVLHGLA